MPAPNGNSNATKHARFALVVGSFPDGCQYIENGSNAYRRHLERAVAAANGGKVTQSQAELIQSAATEYGRARMMRRWLNTEEKIGLADRIALLKEEASANASRLRYVRELGLNQSPVDGPSPAALPDLSDYEPTEVNHG